MENLVPLCHPAEGAQPLWANRRGRVQRKNSIVKIDVAVDAIEFAIGFSGVQRESKTYSKTGDLTKNGLTEPRVDESASAPLDLWARERGTGSCTPTCSECDCGRTQDSVTLGYA